MTPDLNDPSPRVSRKSWPTHTSLHGNDLHITTESPTMQSDLLGIEK